MCFLLEAPAVRANHHYYYFRRRTDLSGVGYAVAEAVIEYGGDAFVTSSNPTRVEQAVTSLKLAYPTGIDRIFGRTCDLSDESIAEDNIIGLLESIGELDHIVYTAGDSVPPVPIAEATLEKMKAATTVRYTGAVFLAKHASKHLKASADSSITLTTGRIAQKPIPNWSVIAGPRVAVVGLARNLALDMRPIRVNAVELGAVDTPTWGRLPQEQRETMMDALVATSTTGRIGRPEDVAEAYLYCMRDRNVSGSVIASNGGNLLF